MLKSQFHHLQLLQRLSSSRRKLGKEAIAWPGSNFERKHGAVPTASLARCRPWFQQNLKATAKGPKKSNNVTHSCLKVNRNGRLFRHGRRPQTKMSTFRFTVLSHGGPLGSELLERLHPSISQSTHDPPTHPSTRHFIHP